MAKLGKALGVAYVRIRGDSTKLKGDLNTAHGQVVAAGKRMAMGLGVVGVAVAGVGLAVKGLVKEWVELANEQEAVEKRLTTVVKATGEAAGLSAKQMIDMAGAMQKITTVGDETIIAGQAVLATFKKIRGDGFERATMAALDMSEVMQTDLQSSIVMIGKALNDPIANLSAMSRAGVQFTKDQKDMVKTLWEAGDAAGAQSIILKELESQFGGAAKAAKDTYGGAIKSLTNTIGDVKEELGFAITKNEVFIGIVQDTEKAIIGLVPDIKEAVDQFSRWVDANEDFIKQKIPEYIDRVKSGLESIWKIASYDSDILTYGLIGLVLGGKKWAVVMGGMAHMINWAQNFTGALDNAKKGLVDFSEIATANFKELEELAKRSTVFTGKIGPGTEGYVKPEDYITITPGGNDVTADDQEKLNGISYGADNIELLEQALQQKTEYDNAEIELEKEKIAMMNELMLDSWQSQYDSKVSMLNTETELANKSIALEKLKTDQKKKYQDEAVKNAGNALQLLGQQQKWAFDAYKVFATAEAVVAGVQAAVHAFNAGMSVGGPYAPAVAAAYAAASIAWTAAQVHMITSASFSGGGGGATVPSTSIGTYNVDPTLGIPTLDQYTESQEERGTLTINIQGDFIGDEAYIDSLVDKINQAREDRDVTVNYS